MAVKLINTINRYSGLSTDAKPTGGVAVGSTFFESDSGQNSQYDGSDWFAIFPLIDGGFSNGLVNVDVVHRRVPDGAHFTATHAETLASGSASILLIETPGSAVVASHFVASIDTSAAGTVIWSKIPNATVGTVITAYNNNLTIGGSSEVSVTQNGAVTTTGNILEHGVIGAAASGNKIGGKSGSRNEWVLDNDARYLLQFTASAATNVAWNAMWYEARG